MIVKKKPDAFQAYLADASKYRGSADVVYLPESEEEIKIFLRGLEFFDKRALKFKYREHLCRKISSLRLSDNDDGVMSSTFIFLSKGL